MGAGLADSDAFCVCQLWRFFFDNGSFSPLKSKRPEGSGLLLRACQNIACGRAKTNFPQVEKSGKPIACYAKEIFSRLELSLRITRLLLVDRVIGRRV